MHEMHECAKKRGEEMNVAIVGEKGGGGKTTFATNLAGIQSEQGKEQPGRSIGHGPSGQFSVLERRACRTW